MMSESVGLRIPWYGAGNQGDTMTILFDGSLFGTRRMHRENALGRTYLFAVTLLVAFGFVGRAFAAPANAKEPTVQRSNQTGLATYVVARQGDGLRVTVPVGAAMAAPIDAIGQFGALFGLADAANQLSFDKQSVDNLGYTHTVYRQVHRGVPVFSGVLKAHQNAAGQYTAISGEFYPISDKINVNPSTTSHAAGALARQRAAAPNATVTSQLVIVDPGWYGDKPLGEKLAYYIIVEDLFVPVREAFFIDAHNGRVLDQWTLLETVRNREAWDFQSTGGPGVLERAEGDPATGNAEVDMGYDYAGDTYDYYFRAFGRDSTDDNGLTMTINVNFASSSCPNAFGGGGQATHCTGTASDDVVSHEFTHSVTGFSAGLIYQNQSGQLNEAMSDIFGELVDMFNGNVAFAGPPGGTSWPATGSGPGTDTPNNLRSQCSVPPGAIVTVNSPGSIAGDYFAGRAFFGPELTVTGITANVVALDPSTACLADGPFNNPPPTIAGKIALVDRGICTFAEKVKRAQDAAAIGVIVVNNVPGAPGSNMTGSDPTITIPAVMMSMADGDAIRTELLSGNVNVTLKDAPDGLLDGVRWLVSEDAVAFGNPIRDMWDPTCKGHPDRANSILQTCGGITGADNGGVHSGSGVMNHTFAIMTDGKTFNGETVTAIGPIKSGAVIYRALTVYMNAGTDFNDAFYAISLAAQDLVGTDPLDPRTGAPSGNAFTQFDADQVVSAMIATEMNIDGPCGATQDILNPAPPTVCLPRQAHFADDFEGGTNGWTVSNTSPPTPYDWEQVSSLPFGRAGTAWYCLDPDYGDCNLIDESGVHYLVSPVINLPANMGEAYVMFTHYMESETGWDGGVVSYDNGVGTFVPFTSVYMTYNPYNTTINDVFSGNTNPLAGLEGFSGVGGQWGTTLIRLSEFEGQPNSIPLRIRFEFGKDGCTGYDGWYIDDFEVYECVECSSNANCDDSNACTCDQCLVTELGEHLCGHITSEYGNVDCSPNQQPNLDDILCVIGGFGNFNSCPGGDIHPNCTGNNSISLDDLLSTLAAFGGADPCACAP